MKWLKIDTQIKRIIGFIGNGLLYISVVKPKVFLIESIVHVYKKLFRTNYVSTVVQTLDKEFQLILDVNDRGLTRELLYAKTREVQIIESLSQLFKSTRFKYVIDIGSNVGFFPIFESLYTGEDTRILAIEPVGVNFKQLVININVNGLENQIQPVRLAVGDFDGNIEIYINEKRNQSSIIRVGNGGGYNPKTEKVRMVTLETLFMEYKIPMEGILLRFDIEGYEYNLITKNKKFLKELRNSYIAFELHTKVLGIEKSLKVLEELRNIGFNVINVSNKYPPHIYILPKKLQSIGMMFMRMRMYPVRGGENNWDVTYDEVYRRIRNGEYYPVVHLILFKE